MAGDVIAGDDGRGVSVAAAVDLCRKRKRDCSVDDEVFFAPPPPSSVFSLGLLSIPNRKPVGSSNLLESNGTPSGHMAPEHGRTSAPGPASGGTGGVLPNRRHGQRRRPVWPLHLPHHRVLSRYLLWGLLAVCGGGGDVPPGHQGLPLPPMRQGHRGALPRHGRQRELQPVRSPVPAAVPCG
jgi:hypothetical protein